MRFVDQVRIVVRAGKGGDGLVGWRREKLAPDGGPRAVMVVAAAMSSSSPTNH